VIWHGDYGARRLLVPCRNITEQPLCSSFGDEAGIAGGLEDRRTGVLEDWSAGVPECKRLQGSGTFLPKIEQQESVSPFCNS
jgi:hypothetical protein